MKIAFIVRHLNKSGGISRYVSELISEYVKHHEVHVFTSSCDVVMGADVIVHKVPIISIRTLKRYKLYALNVLVEKLSFMIISCFIVKKRYFNIVHNQGDYIGLSDVYTAHSCHMGWLQKYASLKTHIYDRLLKSRLNPLHMLLLYIEKCSVIKSRQIIAVSEKVKQELLECYTVNNEKIVVIPNGVNIDEFTPNTNSVTQSSIRDKYGIGSDDIVIIFPAHEYHRKGLSQLISAVSSIETPKIYVMVVGRDNPTYFQKLVAKQGCLGRVIFVGHTDKISEYFNASDMLVFPTIYEPFGLIITEAMATGLPVVVSRCAGAAELITDGVNGLLINDPNDIDEIHSTILKLSNNATIRREMGRAARLTVLNYTWPMIADRTMNIYRSMRSDVSLA